jgi:hypothetical protein
MNIYDLNRVWNIICQKLSIKKLLNLTGCNRNLLNSPFFKEKCQEKYQNKGKLKLYPLKRWRGTLSLLKFGFKERPIVINYCGNCRPRLKYWSNLCICANDTVDYSDDCTKWTVESIENDQSHCDYVGYGFRYVILEKDHSLIDTLGDSR